MTSRKMRKPDGVPVADMLNRSRSSLSNLAPELALARPGMRRKSVLPRSVGKMSDPPSLSDDDEVEDQLFAASRESSPLSEPSVDCSDLTDLPSSSSRSASSTTAEEEIVTDRTPTPIPPIEAEAADERYVVEVEPVPTKPVTSVSKRTSPRKQTLSSQLKARQPSTLAARPRPSRLITPSSRAREALAAMPEPNLPARTVKSTSHSSASAAKRL